MPVATLITRSCVIVRRGPSTDVDEYGNEIPVEETIATVCELQQQQRDEPGDQAEVSSTVWRAFFRPGASVLTGDVLLVDGERYELVGDPWPARNPRTRVTSHVEATVKRVAGTDDEQGSGS